MRSRAAWALALVALFLLTACGGFDHEERRETLEGVWTSEPLATEFGTAVMTLALKADNTYSMRFDPKESDLPAWTGRGLWRVEDRWLILEGKRLVRRRMTLRADVLDLEATETDPLWRLRRVP
ncbi:MAG: hypothetical protein H6806_02855 [Planctomycetes bacterium]|nr:hypothetical protein [Planctomycetota bacterium]